MEKKTQRGMLRNSLVGLGFLLVVALALRHLRTPETSEREDKTGSAATEPMAGATGRGASWHPAPNLPPAANRSSATRKCGDSLPSRVGDCSGIDPKCEGP